MTTFSQLISNTRNELMSGWPDRINQLSANVDASTPTINLTHALTGIDNGSRLSVGLEDMLVLSVASQSVTVIRGWGGSTPTAHSENDLVYVSPPFSDFFIAQKLNEALHDMSGRGLYRVRTSNFSYTPAQSGYDLTGVDDLISIIQVRYDIPGPAQNWPVIYPRDWYLDQAADSAEFPSGLQIVLRRGGFPGHDIKVTYKARYQPLVNLSDDVETVAGLHLEAHDIPPLFAAFRLNTGREVKRSLLTRQPEPRRQEEVPPGSAQLAQNVLMDVYEARIKTEFQRLLRKFAEAV